MTLLLVCNGEEVVVPNAITLTDAIVLLRHQLQDQIMHSQYSHFTMYCSVCLYLWVLRLNYASSSCIELSTGGNEVLVVSLLCVN